MESTITITPKTNAVPKLTLTRREAAEALQVSLPVLDALIRRTDHPIPVIKLSASGRRGKILVSSQALAEWIAEETARTTGSAARR